MRSSMRCKKSFVDSWNNIYIEDLYSENKIKQKEQLGTPDCRIHSLDGNQIMTGQLRTCPEVEALQHLKNRNLNQNYNVNLQHFGVFEDCGYFIKDNMFICFGCRKEISTRLRRDILIHLYHCKSFNSANTNQLIIEYDAIFPQEALDVFVRFDEFGLLRSQSDLSYIGILSHITNLLETTFTSDFTLVKDSALDAENRPLKNQIQ
eukprot:NODE_92_length_21543_cov_0.719036.p8 type:complete len:206 gc:universal NODE_92_length_21543_cov_0.719036:18144-17527(-)